MKKICVLFLVLCSYNLDAVTVNYRNAGNVPTTLDFRSESVTLAPVTIYNGMPVSSINVQNSNADLFINSVHYPVVVTSGDVSIYVEISPGVTELISSLPVTASTYMLFVVVQADGSVTLSTAPY